MLTITDLTYRIAGRTLLEGANAVVPDGAKIGLVGRNGTGKTTLFNLICGELHAESGDISLSRGAKMGRVAQEAPGTDDTLIEYVLKADVERTALLAEAETATDAHRIADIQMRLADIDAYSAEARAATILAGLGFDAEAQARTCKSFSGGWRMRVALAAVLFTEPDLLLLDEPTNYLDLEGTLWLESYIARYPYSVLLISHDRDLLDKAVTGILHLEHNKITFWRGGYTQFARQRREKAMLLEKAKEKQDAKRKHLQSFVDRFRAKATKARQAQSRLKMLEKMEFIEGIVDEVMPPIHIPSPKATLAPPILAFDKVSVGYEAGKPVLSNLTLRIDDDDRIALLGKNGNGKSTLAKLIAERLESMGGSITRASKLNIAFFAQHQLDELVPEESPVAHVRRLMLDAPESKVRARTAKMGLDVKRMDTPAAELSGGERARLLLGMATFHGPNLLILDEPTNHLDIEARESLMAALNDFSGAVILIAHDRHLVEATMDRLWLVADGKVQVFDGDMDDYKRYVLSGTMPKRKAEPAVEAKPEIKTTGSEKRKQNAEKRSELAPLRKRIQAIEKKLEQLRGALSGLDLILADAALFAKDPARGAKFAKDRSDTEKAIEAAEEEWLMLSEEYEAAVAG
ncbi:putative ABC transporter ATP-binding protein YheS [Hartmannibacter diazotrophicus]|uniref:Putative ABC transporter ATP-binding protein YheS n=1 Tax=Hartmannibacter diazotrophicus TaxID=1482074 RepID=A0A2C9D5Q9_9HYPH|nr:ABC-F family ATP-binding cassette domain-containing protein [Hartmannibacter diazotrophicus]SON55478.1 putative ABC transporter ATP-binding protein YheS [Hartmannibacter diazotrophicus]